MARTVDKIHATEYSYGLDKHDRRFRFPVNVGDGALEGPVGLGIGNESARRTGLAGDSWGALDGFHALDKAGEYADKAVVSQIAP